MRAATSTTRTKRYLLEAAAGYGQAATGLRDGLATMQLGSRGLRAWREWLACSAGSARFRSLAVDTERLLTDLAEVRYMVQRRVSGR